MTVFDLREKLHAYEDFPELLDDAEYNYWLGLTHGSLIGVDEVQDEIKIHKDWLDNLLSRLEKTPKVLDVANIKIEKTDENVWIIDNWLRLETELCINTVGEEKFVITNAVQLRPISAESGAFFWMDYIPRIEKRTNIEEIQYWLWSLTLEGKFKIEFI